jgi:outer membrane protein TolC
MRNNILLATIVSLAAAGTASGQTTAAQVTQRLTVEDAVRMALDHNVDLSVDRIDPQISDTRVAAASAAFRPIFTTGINRNNQLQPPASFLIPQPTLTDAVTTSAGISQKLTKYGTAYNVSWNAVHTDTNSVLTSYNPYVQSGLVLSVSQPLFRDLFIDQSRQQLATSRVNRDIADTRLRESVVRTTSDVKTAYWNLVSAIATVDARKAALDRAQELVRVNKARVDVGQSPALDLVSAQAEVASDQEQLIIAQTAVDQLQDRLRLLMFDATDRSAWTITLDPIDSPPTATIAPNVEEAVTTAIRERSDLQRARKDIDNAATNAKYLDSQRLPDVRLNASYAANGLAGTQISRPGGFTGPAVATGVVTGFGDAIGQLFGRDYPTWVVGVNVSYPLGRSVDDANYARARLERTQSEQRLKSAEARAIQQVRDAARQIQMNAQRIETTRAARELAEQRLDAEQKRLDVGMSTSFLVIQAQRDLTQAKTNELGAVLAYDLSLVNFETVQQAPPVASGAAAATTSR